MKAVSENHFQQYASNEAIAEQMIPVIGRLYRNNDVRVLLCGQSLLNQSVIYLMKAHQDLDFLGGETLSLQSTWPILEAVATLDIKHAAVDLGKFAKLAAEQNISAEDLPAFVAAQLTAAEAHESRGPVDVVLYGFGRIGRLLARLMLEEIGAGNDSWLRNHPNRRQLRRRYALGERGG